LDSIKHILNFLLALALGLMMDDESSNIINNNINIGTPTSFLLAFPWLSFPSCISFSCCIQFTILKTRLTWQGLDSYCIQDLVVTTLIQ
jgi:hypothetical protein